MDQTLLDYLDSLGATSPVIEGVETALRTYGELGIVWDEAFLSETVDDAGQRVWGSFWLFSHEYLLEARDVATTANHDVAAVTAYQYARFELKDFDWRAATHESRMFATFALTTGIQAEVRASGKNCERLARMVKEYVMPHLKRE